MKDIERIEELIDLQQHLDKIQEKYFSHLKKYLIGNIKESGSKSNSKYFFTRPNYDEDKKEPLMGQFSTTFVLFSALNMDLSLIEIERGFDKERVVLLEKEIRKKLGKKGESYSELEKKIQDELNEKLRSEGIVKNYVENMRDPNGNGWWFPYFDEPFDIYTTPFKLICYSKALQLLNMEKKT